MTDTPTPQPTEISGQTLAKLPKNPRRRRCYNKDLPTPTEMFEFLQNHEQSCATDEKDFEPATFMASLPDIDMTDPMALHGMIEQHCNLLNRAFHLILLRYDIKDYHLAFKAQRLLRSNLPIVERYAGHHLSVYDYADEDIRPHNEQIEALVQAHHHTIPKHFVKTEHP